MINVSIVIYHNPAVEVQNIVRQLRECSAINEIWLIDNSEIQTEVFMSLPATYIFNNQNMGYGRAHNIALEKSLRTDAKYHLVINSDIILGNGTIDVLLRYMEENPDVGQCMPMVRYPNGTIQRLAKLLPTPYDLIVRRFLPKSLTRKRTRYFELHDAPAGYAINVPYLSGCFMLLRCDALRKTGLFDQRFFMYPEDIDLTRRIHRHYKTVFYPMTEIIHNHAQKSYHSTRMLWIHIVNMCRYFNKWGWLFDSERTKINRQTLLEISRLRNG